MTILAGWRAAIFVLVLMGAVGGWVWYKNRAVPHYVTCAATGLGITEYGDEGISSIKPLVVRFSVCGCVADALNFAREGAGAGT